MKILLIVIGVLVLALFMLGSFFLRNYNKVVALEEGVSEAWGQVETQLQRRYDLIPNLVETVKGYAKHEKEVFTEITKARAMVGSAQTIPDKIAANNNLTSALGRLLVVVENYPDLKASQNFLNLQDELAGTENRISVARRRYNIAVKDLNTFIKGFPGMLFARIKGTQEAAYFEAPEDAKTAPKVSF
ncbi:MAG: LemA family protein [Candidatus Coatesbacteria bacterium]|nr:LemA family protein [Candidatus Coatesbacteria bacterium]